MTADYYQILQVSPTSSTDEIRKAYRKLALKHHPDKGGNAETFAEFLQAKEILEDPEKRRKYDSERTWSTGGGSHRSGFSGFTGGSTNQFRTSSTRSEPKFRSQKFYTSSSRTGYYDEAYQNFSHAFHGSRYSEGYQYAQDRTYKSNPFQRSTFGDKKDTFERMFKNGRFARRQHPPPPPPPPNDQENRNQNQNRSRSRWGVDDDEPEEDADIHTRTTPEKEPNLKRSQWDSTASSYSYVRESPVHGNETNTTTASPPMSSDSATTGNTDPKPDAKFGFAFEPAADSTANPEADQPAAGGFFESDADDEGDDLKDHHTAKAQHNRRHFSAKYTNWSNGFRATPDESNMSSSDEGEHEHDGDDEGNHHTEFVDLTNDSDEEYPQQKQPQQDTENGDQPPNAGFEPQQSAQSQQQPHPQPQTHTGKRQPSLNSDSESDLDDDILKSPKKKARTATYKSMRDDFLNEGPFTETYGNFAMDDIAETIFGKGKRPQSPQKEPSDYIGPGRKRPNYNTTSTPVNTQQPKAFRPKQFELQDHVEALQINAPVPPIAPDLATVTNEALEHYGKMIEQYQQNWTEYNRQMNLYQQRRLEADASYGLELFKTSQGLKEYMSALQLDAKMKSLWNSAYDTHIRVMNEFINVTEYVDRMNETNTNV